jgi:transmembrane sensor
MILMNKQTLKELLVKRQQGTITTEELGLLETWYNRYADSAEPFADTDRYILDMQALDNSFAAAAKSPSIRLWPRLVAAAVALVILGAGLFYYKLNTSLSAEQTTGHYANDVAPGKMGATLTLASGKKIRLGVAANGEIAKEAGMVVSKTADGQLVYEVSSSLGAGAGLPAYNTLATANGETYRVHLPDGSWVWLNASSSLKYPASFEKSKNRSVELTGEGYFEIAKDKAHPFLVKSAGQQVEVLGTHFNINAYTDEPNTATTLLEGSVKISTENLSKTISPGEQAISRGRDISTVTVNPESITDWKDGDFVLNGLNFKTAMRKIARWYDVEVHYDSSVPDELESGGWISRNTKLSEVLTLIEQSGQVQFKIAGKKLFVSKKITNH